MPTSQLAGEPALQRRGPAGAMHVLIVEDDASVREVCAEVAGSWGCYVSTADSLPAAEVLIAGKPLDVIFLDLRLPGGSGALLLQQIRERQPRAQVIVMTAYATVNTAVELMRGGASDLLQKPFALDQISAILERAREQRQWSAPSRVLQDRLSAGVAGGSLIGRSDAMQKVFRIVSKVALTRHPVLILGESGTGKELVARTIHGSGPEPSTPFVPIDCNAIAPEFLEREMFGAMEETAAGTSRRRPGALAGAGAGTVYMDEISALPAPLQVKLLRALESRQVNPVGGEAPVRFDARILASSSRELQTLVETGRFRKDLFYRLNVVGLHIPPLRERTGDVALLADHFLERQRREHNMPFVFSDEAFSWIDAYSWPDNVRELENVIARVCALASGPVVHFDDLSTQLHAYAVAVAKRTMAEKEFAEAPAGVETIEASERRTILQALHTFHGDKIMAAKALGIGKTTLYRKLKEYGIGEAQA